eukprot:CAMPEP_0116094330 /NCGR_PEP_ID=MMETSP0327-20121206/9073_1 /TAXON_ID=44447 /ORGANISM="Pseudo-nitzschia delicatissima, Strain B596" /LENGTH=77 /DNA_ID=CAMNT_0003585925 /DNA_START=56 /DNA_END=289 /DNA_ORIENTATION=+
MAKNNFFYSIIWLVVLVFLAWPLAMAVSWIWILLQPIEAVLPEPVKSINRFLEKLVTWPRDLGYAITKGQASFPAPF